MTWDLRAPSRTASSSWITDRSWKRRRRPYSSSSRRTRGRFSSWPRSRAAPSEAHLPIAFADIADGAQGLKVGQHGLAALRPRYDVIDMEGHGGILRRAGAAHAAEAIVADQDRGAQAPVDVARRAGRCPGAPGKSIAAAAFADEGFEGAQRAVPGAEAPLDSRSVQGPGAPRRRTGQKRTDSGR